jgi:hypothetical protein
MTTDHTTTISIMAAILAAPRARQKPFNTELDESELSRCARQARELYERVEEMETMGLGASSG